MGLSLREALRRLCVEIGWSYAVFWKAVGLHHPQHLVWEDGYCGTVQEVHNDQSIEIGSQSEDGVQMLVNKRMVLQVHIVGEGIIGRAALTGAYRWIARDAFNVFESASRGVAEMNQQFLAGIQTIVAIPVLPRGVLQVGSTQLVMEEASFIIHAKRIFSLLNSQSSSFPSETTQRPLSEEDKTYSASVMSGTLCKITELECEYPHSNVRLSQQEPRHIKRSENQIQPVMGSSDFGCSLKLLEEFLLMQNVGSIECQNSGGPPTDVTKTIQWKTDGRHNHIWLEDANIASLPGRDELVNEGSNLVKGECLPDDVNVISAPCTNISNGMSCQISDQEFNTPGKMETNHSFCTQEIAQAVPMSNISSSHCNSLLVNAGHVRRVHRSRSSIPSPNAQQFSTSGIEANDSCTDMNGENTSPFPLGPTCGNELFDVLCPATLHQLCGGLDSVSVSRGETTGISVFSSCPDTVPVFNSVNGEFSHTEVFSVEESDQLLDAMLSNINPHCKASLTDIHSSCGAGSSNHQCVSSTELKQDESFGVLPAFVNNETAGSCYVKHPCFSGRAKQCSQSLNLGVHKSQICLWIESGQVMKSDSISSSNSTKTNRKQSRPGESPRPRPKDRQLIQDCIKELREIVPNGAKCSIDALLEKTIKHMLFLQSVTKHADKLKETGESKIAGKDGSLLLKDCFEGGATWAFEVGSQSMVCPIIIEDINPPRLMLVELLCDDRGIFLEIAYFIRGLGLTILKGVMEARKNKIWARFSVEANRDMTRMEVFLLLVRLLEPNAGTNASQNPNKINVPHIVPHQLGISTIGLSDGLR